MQRKGTARISPNEFIENLEPRRLLSGSIARYNIAVNPVTHERTLNITLTPGPDKFKVDAHGRETGVDEFGYSTFVSDVTVTFGEGTQRTQRKFSGITYTAIDAGAGPDFLEVRGKNLDQSTWMPIIIKGGSGNDLIVTPGYFDGVVQIDAGDGDDRIDVSKSFGKFAILGPASFRNLDGGNGNDVIIGSNADDVLYGGAGNDKLYGGSGDDELRGQGGNNLVDGGAGDDRIEVSPMNGLFDGDILNKGGKDTITGGPGDDFLLRLYNSSYAVPVFGYKASGIELEIPTDVQG